MKTFRLFIAAIILLFLAVGIAGAQGKKTTETYSWPVPLYYVTCTNENIVGEESCVVTVWDGKYQCRYEGNYTGESGKSYTWSAFEMRSYKEGKASNETYIVKMILKCEGVPIAYSSFKSHVTINANGEVTVERAKGLAWEWICK
jgi:hypothetical protein